MRSTSFGKWTTFAALNFYLNQTEINPNMKRRSNYHRAHSVCFRQWGNKSYSVFASLKAWVKISVISVSYSLLVMPVCAVAQVDTIPTTSRDIDIDEVVITSPLAASTYSELMRAVAVISRDEIAQMPVSNLNDLLRSISSVDLRQRGGNGVQADIAIRGGTFDQVLILLNDVNITDPQTGHHNLNIPIDLESIERVELLQGPGARIYGPGSFSGAINIITNPRGKEFTKISASVGEYGLVSASASANLVSKRSNLFIATSSAKSNGYIQNTDFNLHNLFSHASVDFWSGSIDFQAGYQDKAFGAQSFYTPRFPEQFEKIGTFFSSVTFSKRFDGITIAATGYHRQHTDRFELFRRQIPEWYKGHNYHRTLASGGKVQLTSLNTAGRTRIGAEVRNESIMSNVLGEPLKVPVSIKGVEDTTYTRGAERNQFNAFADHTFYLKKVIVSGGALLTYSTSYRFNWNYGVDISYIAGDKTNIYASVSNTLRFPTFTDLYYNGPTNRGNVALKPEKANNFEIGTRVMSKKVSGSVTLFHRRAHDVIDWVKELEGDIWTTMNHTSINTTGIESAVIIRNFNNIPFIKEISLGYNYVFSSKESETLQSYYALDYLKHKFLASINHAVFWKIGASWTALWHDRAGTYTRFSNGEDTPYSPFLLINLKVYADFSRFKTVVDISNLGNITYFDLGNIPQPQRWVSFGLKYTMGN